MIMDLLPLLAFVAAVTILRNVFETWVLERGRVDVEVDARGERNA